MTQAGLQQDQTNKIATTGVVRLADYGDIPQLVEWGANIHGADRKHPYDHNRAAEYFAGLINNPSLAVFVSDRGFIVGTIAYEELETPFPVVVVVTGWATEWSDLLWALEQWAHAAGAIELRMLSPVGTSDVADALANAGYGQTQTIFRKTLVGLQEAEGKKGRHNGH